MTRRRPGHLVATIVPIALLVGCSGGDGSENAQTVATTNAAADTSVTTFTSDSEVPSTTNASSTSPPTSAETATTVPAGPPMFAGLEGTVTLRTPEAGGGTRPVLTWDPVDGATRYTVAVYAPDGRMYWSWATVATAIPMGGEPPLREDAPGPSVTAGMTWAVVAFGPDDLPIAVSEARAIAP